MFDIGWSELLVIAVVAIVVVGPKELPKLMRSFGHYAGKFRRAAAEFRRQFDDAMREAELDEVRQAIESVRTETRVLEDKPPLGQPLMVEGPPTPTPPAPQQPTPTPAQPVEAKPAAKTPRKRAAKAKAPAKRSKNGAEPAP
ncbi:MAG TPA: Sec-independent protein translocase protein TatB [Methyloceanibacter sp.]|jgi:sec-independent protein translocase protein TatB|nr:Sec-independent protein translocase protein TatB [Methyloceanibacter sp.]